MRTHLFIFSGNICRRQQVSVPTAGNPSGPITTSCGTPRDSETIWRPQLWKEPSGEITIRGEGGERKKSGSFSLFFLTEPKKKDGSYGGTFFQPCSQTSSSATTELLVIMLWQLWHWRLFFGGVTALCCMWLGTGWCLTPHQDRKSLNPPSLVPPAKNTAMAL